MLPTSSKNSFSSSQELRLPSTFKPVIAGQVENQSQSQLFPHISRSADIETKKTTAEQLLQNKLLILEDLLDCKPQTRVLTTAEFKVLATIRKSLFAGKKTPTSVTYALVINHLNQNPATNLANLKISDLEFKPQIMQEDKPAEIEKDQDSFNSIKQALETGNSDCLAREYRQPLRDGITSFKSKISKFLSQKEKDTELHRQEVEQQVMKITSQQQQKEFLSKKLLDLNIEEKANLNKYNTGLIEWMDLKLIVQKEDETRNEALQKFPLVVDEVIPKTEQQKAQLESYARTNLAWHNLTQIARPQATEYLNKITANSEQIKTLLIEESKHIQNNLAARPELFQQLRQKMEELKSIPIKIQFSLSLRIQHDIESYQTQIIKTQEPAGSGTNENKNWQKNLTYLQQGLNEVLNEQICYQELMVGCKALINQWEKCGILLAQAQAADSKKSTQLQQKIQHKYQEILYLAKDQLELEKKNQELSQKLAKNAAQLQEAENILQVINSYKL